jgi:hypothetical protein
MYEQPSSLAIVAGVYRRLTVDGPTEDAIVTVNGDGAITGTREDGCTFNGQMSVLDPDRNLYAFELTATDCAAQSGQHEGLALLDDELSEHGTALVMLGASESRPMGFVGVE